ncbi:MAG: MATE family efflux transporter [Myxococcota bacterium]
MNVPHHPTSATQTGSATPDGPRWRAIAALALPIIGGMVSQNVLNLVDTAMVGSLGDAALAAVSTASFVNFACIAGLAGLSAAVQVLAARLTGENRLDERARPLHEGILIALVIGIPASALLVWIAPAIYPNDDPDVAAQAVPYLRARLVAMSAVGINFAFRGYWNGVSRSGIYMSTLIAMHVSNVILSYALIFGVPALGIEALGALGAGVGTSIATFFGTVLYLILGVLYSRPDGFLRVGPSLESMRSLVSLGLPQSLQQTLFALGYNVLFVIIAQIGTQEPVAAAGVLVNLTLVAILPGLALGMTAATLVGQAIGQGDLDDAERWGWDVVKVGLVILGALGLPMIFIPEWLLAPFLPGRPETVALAAPALRIVGVSLAFDAVGMVLMQALLAAGASRFVATWSVGLQWLGFLPLAYLVGPVAGFGLTGIWLIQALQRAAQAAIFARAWRARWWRSLVL